MKSLSMTIAVSMLMLSLAPSYIISGEVSTPTSRLIGSWEVYKDDDRPKGPIPNEIMNFWHNGKFQVIGDHTYKGIYRIKNDQLEMLVKIEDKAISLSRKFLIFENELRFKNEKVGWIYYKRNGKKPSGDQPIFD